MTHPPAEPTHADIPSTGTSTPAIPTTSTTPTNENEYMIRLGRPEDAGDISKLMTEVFSSSFGHSCTTEELNKYTSDVLSVEPITKDLENPLCIWYLAYSPSPSSSPSSSSSSSHPSPYSSSPSSRSPSKGKELVGIVQLTQNSFEPCLTLPNPIELQRIYLSSKTHGTGLSKRLIELAENKSRELKYKSIWLGVWEKNNRAKRFYQKMGYKVVGEHWFDVGGDRQRDEVMEKLL